MEVLIPVVMIFGPLYLLAKWFHKMDCQKAAAAAPKVLYQHSHQEYYQPEQPRRRGFIVWLFSRK